MLTLVAKSRNEQGHPNFQAHPITRFYEEVIQATQGSRWVLCLTLASAWEGLAKMLMDPVEQKSDFTEDDIASLKKWVADWVGSKKLKDRTLGNIKTASKRSLGSYLNRLVQSNVLAQSQVGAWTEIRHSVMHGNLVTPWSTKEEDERLLDLANLVHGLTRELLHKEVGENSIG